MHLLALREYKERNYQTLKTNNMRTKFANLLKSALLIGAVMCCFSSCTYIPHNELDGKILTDENGKKYKLEWQSGYGESWRFLEQVKDATGKDTATRWKYVSKK